MPRPWGDGTLSRIIWDAPRGIDESIVDTVAYRAPAHHKARRRRPGPKMHGPGEEPAMPAAEAAERRGFCCAIGLGKSNSRGKGRCSAATTQAQAETRMTEGTAYTTIAVSLIVIAACWLAVVLGLGIGVWLAGRRIRSLSRSFRPPMDQLAEATTAIRETAQTARDGTRSVADTIQDTTRDLSERTKRLAALVEEAVSTPLVTFTCILAGVSKALEALRRQSEE